MEIGSKVWVAAEITDTDLENEKVKVKFSDDSETWVDPSDLKAMSAYTIKYIAGEGYRVVDGSGEPVPNIHQTHYDRVGAQEAADELNALGAALNFVE